MSSSSMWTDVVLPVSLSALMLGLFVYLECCSLPSRRRRYFYYDGTRIGEDARLYYAREQQKRDAQSLLPDVSD
jgi:hypothetical protein